MGEIHPVIQAYMSARDQALKYAMHLQDRELNKQRLEEAKIQHQDQMKVEQDRLAYQNAQLDVRKAQNVADNRARALDLFGKGLLKPNPTFDQPISQEEGVQDIPGGLFGLNFNNNALGLDPNSPQMGQNGQELTVPGTEDSFQVPSPQEVGINRAAFEGPTLEAKSKGLQAINALKARYDYERMQEQERLRGEIAEKVANIGAGSREKVAKMNSEGRLAAAAKRAQTARETSNKGETLSLRIAQQHDMNPLTKRYILSNEAVQFVNSLSNTSKNPADDQGLIYAFAKAMDPESVVREGEYATVMKYSQAWKDKFGFDVKRLFNNSEFLKPEARKFLKQTILSKANATGTLYKGYRKGILTRIEKISPGNAESILGDVTQFMDNPNRIEVPDSLFKKGK